MNNITKLPTASLPPMMFAAMNRLQDKLWEALDGAAEDGLPVAIIVGQMECIKHAIIDDRFRKTEQEQ